MKRTKWITHLYCLVVDRAHSIYAVPNTDGPMTARLNYLIACGNEIEWADVMPSIVWKLWMSTITEMPSNASEKLCSNTLKELSVFRWLRLPASPTHLTAPASAYNPQQPFQPARSCTCRADMAGPEGTTTDQKYANVGRRLHRLSVRHARDAVREHRQTSKGSGLDEY